MPTNKQRRESARRHLERQLQRRQEREARRRKVTLITSVAGTIVLIAVIVLVLVVWAGSSDKKTPAASSKTPTTSASPSSSVSPSTTASASAAAYPCTWTKSGTASKKAAVPPTTKPSKTGTVNATVTTSRGALTFTLNRAAAPCAVESFLSLANQKYFDSTPCHRLTTTGIYVLQCGDPSGTGSGGPGYSFGDELTGKEKYTAGVLAMANSGPNTNGSQFFIVYKDSTLGPSYTVFGSVTKGLSVVDAVAAGGANPSGDGKPKLAINLTTVRAA